MEPVDEVVGKTDRGRQVRPIAWFARRPGLRGLDTGQWGVRPAGLKPNPDSSKFRGTLVDRLPDPMCFLPELCRMGRRADGNDQHAALYGAAGKRQAVVSTAGFAIDGRHGQTQLLQQARLLQQGGGGALGQRLGSGSAGRRHGAMQGVLKIGGRSVVPSVDLPMVGRAAMEVT